nr:DUF861 domain-containing protein [Sphingobium sp.]
MSAVIERTVGAVVDMRAYAAGTAPSVDWFAGRKAPAFADDAAQVAAFALRGEGRVEGLDADEFVLVLKGSLEIESDADTLTVLPDAGAVLPVGIKFRWRASDDLLAIVYTAPTQGQGSATAPVPIDLDADLTPSGAPATENLIGPVPSCRNHSDYLSANGEFVCGIWDSTPYHRRQIAYRQVELMLLLEGEVRFSDAGGSVAFQKGDICMFVRGDGCAWLSGTYVKKIYATQRPLS